MILLAVGTQLPFDRLVRAVDEWAGAAGRTDVVGQIGPSDYRPRHIAAQPHFAPERFRALQGEAELLVAHCGMGSILSALELGQPVIVMPRLQRLGEHRNDHQLATAGRFKSVAGVHVAGDECALRLLLERVGELTGAAAISPKAPRAFTDRLAAFIATGVR